MPRWGQDHVDQGEESYEQRHRERWLVGTEATAKSLGYTMVPLTKAQAVGAGGRGP